MSPFAGVIADRFDRRQILLVTNLLRAVTVASFLLVDRPERLWLLYVLTALQFVFSAVFFPAETALIPNVVAEDDLVTANALDSLTWSTMLALGAMLGGIATALLGVTTAFLLDALSFLLSAWFVSRVQLPPAARRPHTGATGVRDGFAAIVEGLRYLGDHRFIMAVALAKAGGSLVWGAVNVLEIPLAEQVYPINNNGALTLGLIYAATGIGTGVGPLLLRRWLGDTKPSLLRGVSIGFGLMTIGVTGIGLAGSLPMVLGFTTVRGLGTGALWVFSTVALQQILPDHIRGRVFATEFAAMTLTQSFSTVWAGYAADTLGLSLNQIFLTMGLTAALVTAAWLAFQITVERRGEVWSDG